MGKRAVHRRNMRADRVRGSITFGADASDAVFDNFPTGLSIDNDMAWDVLWFAAWPQLPASFAALAGDCALRMQLMYGIQTALVEDDGILCCCSGGAAWGVVASGGIEARFPVFANVRAPIPTLAQRLTVGFLGVDEAAMNSKKWYYEVGYLKRPAMPREGQEFFQAHGAL